MVGSGRSSLQPGLAALRDFRRSWPQLAVTDLLTRIAVFAVISPLVALVMRGLVRRSGGEAVSDFDLLFFFTSPAGVLTLVVAGGAAVAVSFVEQAPLMAIGRGAAEDRAVTYADAFPFVLPQLGAIFRLGLHIAARVLLISAPFLVAVGGVYLALLTGHDIYFYLNVRPPVFWVAAILAGLILCALAVLLIRVLAGWSLALPILLFEQVAPREALVRSRAVVRRRRKEVLGWLVVWALLGLALSAGVTATTGAIGRLLVPGSGSSLEKVALAVATVLGITALGNLLVSFFSSTLLATLLVRLFSSAVRPPAAVVKPLTARGPLGDRARWRLPRKSLLWVAVVALLALTVSAALLVRAVQVEDRAAITAHRGSSIDAPENTLAAVEQAIRDEADWVEIDVQETSDGVVVILHDRDLMRVAGLSREIADVRYDELTAVDVGSWFGPGFADQRVPTLAQVLDLCRDRIGVNIELKSFGREQQLVARVVELVRERAMESQVTLMSFNRDLVSEAQQLSPKLSVGLLSAVSIGDLTRVDVDFLAVNANLATPSFVRTAHRRGRQVQVWGVSEPIQISKMISRGVDNVITKRPRMARRVLSQRAAMSPVERLLLDVGGQVGLLGDLPPAATEADA